jgi:hypothetical protein
VSFFERIVESNWTDGEIALLRASAADVEFHEQRKQGAPYPGREYDGEAEDEYGPWDFG